MHFLNRNLRKMVNRFSGKRPGRVRPLEEVLAARTCEIVAGVEVSESFAGVLATDSSESTSYSTVAPLWTSAAPAHQQLSGGPRFCDAGLAPPHTVRIWTLTDAVVSGYDGVVACPRLNVAIAETARGWRTPARHHPLLGLFRSNPPESLSGISLHLGSIGSGNFYHFLNDVLARLALIEPWRSRCDHFLLTGERTAEREAWLSAAGVPAERAVWLGARQSVRCAQLIATDLPMHTSRPTWRQVERLRRVFQHQPAAPEPALKLWISRRNAPQRDLKWEDDLIARLPGMLKVTLQDRTPAEQMALFASAHIVVGPHGAGLANLVWAPPGGSLVELFPASANVDPLYGRWAEVLGWRHSWAVVDFERPTGLGELAARILRFVDDPGA